MRLIWGFDSSCLHTESFISKDDIWFGERRNQPNVTYDILKLYKGNLEELSSLSKLGELMSDGFLDLFMRKLDWYMDMYDRTEFGRISSYSVRRDQLILIGHIFYTLIMKNNIQYAFFISPPHFGVDAILADICNYLNIKVYYGYQTLFKNRFYVLDYNFSIVEPKVGPVINEKIPDAIQEKLFCMQNIKVKKIKKISLLGAWFKFLLGSQNSLKFAYNLKKKQRQIAYQRSQRKFETLQGSLEDIEAELKTKKFIYFPLHLQPEMTTSQLGGGKYRDQVAVIWEILRILPKDWVIIVKENPKQNWQYRSDAFFKKLFLDRRIMMVDIGTPSKLLIQYSQLVATISGTVGWEAIRLNKPVICFGKSWFSSLHGVFRFKQNLDLIQVSNVQIENEELQASFNKLLNMSWQGVIDFDYQCLCSEFDLVANIKLIEKLFQDLPKESTQHISF